MQLGMIGLGRMGANIVRRLIGRDTSAWSTTSTEAVDPMRGRTGPPARLAGGFAAKLTTPRAAG